MDSGAGDYERLWLTTSLRGVVNGTLMIKTATEEIHSGDASGVIPSTFRVLRKILDRVDCVDTGYVDERFQVNIPPDRYEEAFVIYIPLKYTHYLYKYIYLYIESFSIDWEKPC